MLERSGFVYGLYGPIAGIADSPPVPPGKKSMSIPAWAVVVGAVIAAGLLITVGVVIDRRLKQSRLKHALRNASSPLLDPQRPVYTQVESKTKAKTRTVSNSNWPSAEPAGVVASERPYSPKLAQLKASSDL